METEKKTPIIFSNAQVAYLESLNLSTTALQDILRTRKEYLESCGLMRGWYPLDVHQIQVWPDKVMTVVECSNGKRVDGKLELETIFYCHEIHRGSNSLPALVYGMVRALELDKEVENNDHL